MNVEGEFYVDKTCINCDTCRQLAPDVFRDAGLYSAVYQQPLDEWGQRKALQAAIACPTGSIGTIDKRPLKEIKRDFPLRLKNSVYYCGFNSQKSFGANSYLVLHPDGNWMIDSPRYSRYLVKQFTQLGGVRFIFLTHRDDVADAHKYADTFSGCERIIHELELSAQPDAEVVIDGHDIFKIHPDFLAVPTPGHTRGHMVLLYNGQFLFTGDHLYFKRSLGHLNAFRQACWYSWDKQIHSMERVLGLAKDQRFEWILPGHGQRIRMPAETIINEMTALIERMKRS